MQPTLIHAFSKALPMTYLLRSLLVKLSINLGFPGGIHSNNLLHARRLMNISYLLSVINQSSPSSIIVIDHC
ncbi:MAG: hypothetical protein A4E52_00780 [Pelotomaculum sp. PtaB.Bin013]|nr:MAG: hypothetical protein A4E52_00780 [Pelotomaculum sp. PtaB.Bin013]